MLHRQLSEVRTWLQATAMAGKGREEGRMRELLLSEFAGEVRDVRVACRVLFRGLLPCSLRLLHRRNSSVGLLHNETAHLSLLVCTPLFELTLSRRLCFG